MQVVEDSKFSLVSSSPSSSVNKYSSVNITGGNGIATNVVGVGGSNQFVGGHHQTAVLRTTTDQHQAPKVQYLGPNCLLIVYNEKEIAALLDEHFSKSLSGVNVEHSQRSFLAHFSLDVIA